MFFGALKQRFFIGKVQAEIKAQHDDQEFVNFVCQRPEAVIELEKFRKSFYGKLKMGPFLAACKVLSINPALPDTPMDVQMVCATLLHQRLRKMRADPKFCEAFQPFLAEVEDTFHSAIARNSMR